MREGVVLQLDTPHALYDNPVNMFVAGFMGSPSMNFIAAEISKSESGYAVNVRNHADEESLLPLPPDGHGDLSAWVGKEIVLGLRPEHITHVIAHRERDPLCRKIACRVEVLEPTGADTLVRILLNGKEASCRIEPRAEVPAGRVATMMFDMSKAVIFDPRTEQRL
jgi:multiple sugar transport system ATP-binding protein